MAWNETNVMEERLKFVAAVIADDETMTALCERFGIARKTGYKWYGRYVEASPAGLEDLPRAPPGRCAACFADKRDPDLTEHSPETLLPVLALLAEKFAAHAKTCAAVAGKSTLNRLELSGSSPTRYHKIGQDVAAIERLLVALFLEGRLRLPTRSSSTSMPPMTPCMARRRAASRPWVH
jgi:Helix-turn-helix domain